MTFFTLIATHNKYCDNQMSVPNPKLGHIKIFCKGLNSQAFSPNYDNQIKKSAFCFHHLFVKSNFTQNKSC